jgi:hypothetical protein
VSHELIRRHRLSDPTFEDEEIQAIAEAIGVVEDALFRTATKGNTTAQIFFLTNRAPEKWRDMRRRPDEPPPAPPDPDPEWRAQMEKARLQFLRDTYGPGTSGAAESNGAVPHTEPPPPDVPATDPPDPPQP